MIDEAMAAFLSSGCSFIVGALTPDGEPFATRGWGARVIDEGRRLRLSVATGDLCRLALGAGDAAASRAIAVTGADVLTLRSVQLKGEVEGVDSTDPRDLDEHRSFCDQFFAAVERSDGTDRRLMERLVPSDLTIVVVRVTQLFDQTPGPRAGRRLEEPVP